MPSFETLTLADIFTHLSKSSSNTFKTHKNISLYFKRRYLIIYKYLKTAGRNERDQYKCIITNEAGTAQYQVYLNVRCVSFAVLLQSKRFRRTVPNFEILIESFEVEKRNFEFPKNSKSSLRPSF